MSRSKVCSLQAINVLPLNDAPRDQCRCKVHKNFFIQLEAMGV